MGLSVNPFVSLKDVKIVFVNFDSILLVIPGKAFCSWMAFGIPKIQAVKMTAKDEKPPTPRIKSGLKFFIIIMDWSNEIMIILAENSLVITLPPLMGFEKIALWAKPYCFKV